MKVYIVRDSDFTLKGSVPASYLLHYDAYAKRFLSSFDEVVLVGRLFEREDPTALPATGPGVTFVGLPGYHGPIGFLKKVPLIIRTVWQTLDRDAAYILRIPATIPTLYSILLRLRGIPFAVEVAADPYDGYSKQALNNSKLAPLFRSLFVRATKWQCKAAAASAYVTREALQKRYPPRSADTSFSFTSIDLLDEAFADRPRSADTFPKSGLHMVMIGNMQKTLKGHDTLIEAIARLKDRGIDVTATVVGFGESLKTFQDLAARLGVSDRLVFTGKLQNGGPVRDVLDTGDLFVLPSRQEGLPRAMLEAMARGLPAVGSRVGGTSELIEEHCLFEAGDIDGLVDRIAAFAGNREALAAASQRNLEFARNYHASIVTRRRQGFFECVASLSGR
jgi:glycosyltransferase involved in cell wall biosynthesis